MKIALRLMLVLALVLSAGAVFAQGDSLSIKDCQAKKPAVTFPHKTHVDAKIACNKCHHTQADLKAGGKAEACSKCHVAPEKATTPKCAEMSMTKNPFHITCVGCHKDEVAKNAASKAPTKCDGCHKA